MKSDRNPLVWVHLEVEGDAPDARVVGISTVVTDGQLKGLVRGPVVRIEEADREAAESTTLAFLTQHVDPGAAPLAGRDAHRCRILLAEQMPRLAAHLHYRNVDLSTLRELLRHWNPEVVQPEATDEPASGIAAVEEAVEELRRYRQTAFV